MIHESYEERKIQLNQQGRIIPAFKHSLLKVPMNRVDRKGNEIGKPGQKYQLTFTDQVQKKPLAQVHCVESYKKYNAEEPAQGETPCCTIFWSSGNRNSYIAQLTSRKQYMEDQACTRYRHSKLTYILVKDLKTFSHIDISKIFERESQQQLINLLSEPPLLPPFHSLSCPISI